MKSCDAGASPGARDGKVEASDVDTPWARAPVVRSTLLAVRVQRGTRETTALSCAEVACLVRHAMHGGRLAGA